MSLSQSEKIAVCFVLQTDTPPQGLTFNEIVPLYTEDKENSVDKRGAQMIVLRDQIDTVIRQSQTRAAGRDEFRALSEAVEALVYKVKNIPDNKIESLYEFKEVKALLGIF